MPADDQEPWLKRPEPWGGYYLMAGETPDVVLARIDERTKTLQGDMDEVKRQLGSHYVTQEAFKNLNDKVALHQKIIMDIGGIICTTVLVALLALVIQKGG